MDKAAGMSIRKMWNYCIFQSSRYRGMKYIIVLGALSAASVSYINSFLYAGILDLLLAKQYSAAKEQILILVVTVVLVSLTARACELMFRHYTEPSALETKKKTAQKTFLMEYEELEKEAVIRAFQRVRRGINGHGGITQQLMDMYHFFTGMIQAVFAAFFLGVLLVQSDFSKENKLLFAVGTAFLLLAFAAFFQLGNLAADRIGKLDLEQYSYEKGSGTPIRATEGTVLSRIPPRMKVRKNAPIELPHIMVLIDDPKKEIIEPFLQKESKKQMQMIYSTTLMEQGGRVSGYLLSKEQADKVQKQLAGLADPARFAQFYHAEGKPVLTYAMGDGNHSLATAKACWEELKPTLSEAERQTHPARYALVELVNLHDDSLEFEPIHRVLFGVDPKQLLADLLAAYPGAHYGAGEGHQITYVLPGERGGILTVPHPTAQLEVGTLQTFLDQYLEAHGGKIDYIHGEDVVEQLVQQPDSIGFLLPGMGKDQLFPTVIFDGALPRKTFSMGEARDKRFYLEARKIK